MDEKQAVTELAEKLKALTPLSTECCIYKVPERLRRLNADAYTPRVVSIGPLHHGRRKLQAMEDHKLRYLHCLIPKTSKSLEEIVQVAKKWETKARLYYADDVKFSSKEFVKMLVVDAGFLVELLLRCRDDVNNNMVDRIYGKQKMIVDVNHDIMLLENQLPYFVVKKMFGLLLRGKGLDVRVIIHEHFKKFWMSIPSVPKTISDPETLHFVDLLRSIHLPMDWRVQPNIINIVDSTCVAKEEKIGSTLSAKEIHDAGVQLKPAESSTYPLEITFSKGVLTIPQIKISDITEALYRNIILYEQCQLLETYFSDYMMFLSCFVRSPVNAEMFIDHRIIVNRRGNAKDISKLFDRVLKGTTQTSYSRGSYQKVYDKLQAYCNTRRHRWLATLNRDYFHTPWSIVSVVAALILLLLTFIQSVCSFLAL